MSRSRARSHQEQNAFDVLIDLDDWLAYADCSILHHRSTLGYGAENCAWIPPLRPHPEVGQAEFNEGAKKVKTESQTDDDVAKVTVANRSTVVECRAEVARSASCNDADLKSR